MSDTPGFRRFVNLIEIVVAVVALGFVIMLFANQPGDGGGAATDSSPGASIYSASCANCHGADGGGGIGPALAGEVVETFPDPADEIDVVTNGRRAMPAFDGSLSAEEIEQVVEYTRTDLGT
jgi:mono/diheme cytochrome c family protein